MVIKHDKVDVVIVGTGWAGGVMAAELGKAGKKVVIIERGEFRETQDYVGVKDELRFTNRFDMMQNLSHETITSRNTLDEDALPFRTQDERSVRTDACGGSVHCAGATYRWLPYYFKIYSQTVERYGKNKIPGGMTIQDWGITYDEMERYYDKWEK